MKALLSCLTLFLATVAAWAGPAVNLRCENLVSPYGVGELQPRLSWRWDGVGAWKQQTAYQVLVASSPDKLAKHVGDLWDTQKILSSSTLVVYDGRALQTHQRCYWKVRVWENTGPSSPWSDVAEWTMGLTKQEEWTGKWIGCDRAVPVTFDGKPPFSPVNLREAHWIAGPDGTNATAPEGKRYFRREFEIPAGAKIVSAALHTAGDNKFTMTVNGKQVASGEDWKNTIPVEAKKLLVPGKNLFLGMVDNISYKGPNSQGPMGLMVSLDVTLEGGQKLKLLSDTSWQTSRDLKAADDQWTASKSLGVNGAIPWGKVRASGVAEYLPATYLRRKFIIARPVFRAVIYATARGIYEFHINGQRVGDEYFAPGFTSYTKRFLYRAYDATKLLKNGDNAIGAILGDGWYRGNVGEFGQNFYGSRTRLQAQMHIFYTDGRRDVLATDENWRAAFGPILEGDLQAGETYDARRELSGWAEGAFDDNKWFKPEVGLTYAETVAPIFAHPGPPVRRIAEIKPVAITEPKPGLRVFNFGQNFAGWARLKVSEKAGTPIVMRFGEMLNADGTVYRENLRGARATDTYVCSGKGTETWEPHFTYRGFQYVEVEGFSKPPAPDALTGIVVHSDNAQTGNFECSNPLLNKIWSNALWSQKSNYLDVPTDCPQRDERLGRTADAQVFVGTAAYNQDIAAFFTKWMKDLEDEQTAEGAFPITAPSLGSGWSPGWADAGVIVPHTLFRHYGDPRILTAHFDAMVKHVKYYESRAPGFLLPDEGLGDRLAIGTETPKILIYNAYLAHSARLVAEMGEVIGKKADAEQIRKTFEDARKAFQQKFVAPDGKIGNGSQTGYLLALRFDLLTPDQRVKAAAWLVKDIEANGNHVATGLLGVNLLLPTLTDIGRTDLAYKVIQKTTFPSWGHSVEQGATTMWERWNSRTKDNGFGPAEMNSFNHQANGACVEWFYRTMLGIDALEPGFAKILIKPEPGPGVTWAKGSYNSVRGEIRSAWKIEGNVLKLDVTIPANGSAELSLPGAAAAMTVFNRPAAQAIGLKLLREEKGRAVFSAQPGSYSVSVAGFTAPSL